MSKGTIMNKHAVPSVAGMKYNMTKVIPVTTTSFYAGYQQDFALDHHLGAPSSRRPAGIYGFWMHTTDGGRSGYLQPGWLAAF
jgi:hypothetical protein